jgi:hypothetical protein
MITKAKYQELKEKGLTNKQISDLIVASFGWPKQAVQI